ncbi:MAG TPA: trypsin-like peptidase domain-containing protein [Anaerolineales bacterium]|nr:trypsin-like peptidase domain-containing protein [Anaerolineales bacterium]
MNKKLFLSVVAVILIGSILACQASSFLPTAVAPTPFPTATASASQTNQAVDLVSQQDKLIALYQAVNPGVVTIQTTTAVGSGWVYSTDGYIVTNQHVVGTATQVEVDFTGGAKVYGNVIGSDQNTDLAVIKVNVPADQLHPLGLGDSDTLKVGQIVVAIGDPELLTGSMTSGIVSALGRSQPSNVQAASGGYYSTGDIIQTDALLNHGNSGGPLLNLDGQVVGVNWAVQVDSTSGLPSGIGYAISINTVKRVVPQLIQNGSFAFPYLGIETRDNLPLNVIDALGLKSTVGIYVNGVTPGGPADKAGIRGGTTPVNVSGYTGLSSGGDLIVAVDGQSVQLMDDMMKYLVLHKSPGDQIVVTVMRGDQKVDLTVTLGKRP